MRKSINTLMEISSAKFNSNKVKYTVNNIWRISLRRDGTIFIFGPGLNNTGGKFDVFSTLFYVLLSKIVAPVVYINFFINLCSKFKIAGNVLYVGSIHNVFFDKKTFDFVVNSSSKVYFVQHGGNFGEYKINKFEEAEVLAADKFIYWNICCDGVRQTRFGFYHYLMAKINSIFRRPRIRIVEYSYGTECTRKSISSDSNRCNEISRLIDCLNNMDIRSDLILHKHPDNLNKFNDFSKNVETKVGGAGSELSSRDIVIFDGPSHTLMYFCISYEIPFYILWDPRHEIGMTHHAIEFYKMLGMAGLLININENTIKDEFFYSIFDRKNAAANVKIVSRIAAKFKLIDVI